MKLTLSDNIRNFRRQRKLTQEKLAEALGVTPLLTVCAAGFTVTAVLLLFSKSFREL